MDMRMSLAMMLSAIAQSSIGYLLPIGWLASGVWTNAASAADMYALHLLNRNQPCQLMASSAASR